MLSERKINVEKRKHQRSHFWRKKWNVFLPPPHTHAGKFISYIVTKERDILSKNNFHLAATNSEAIERQFHLLNPSLEVAFFLSEYEIFFNIHLHLCRRSNVPHESWTSRL